MPYHVTCDWVLAESFDNKDDAFKFVDEKINLWNRTMGWFVVPHYQVWYDGGEVKR